MMNDIDEKTPFIEVEKILSNLYREHGNTESKYEFHDFLFRQFVKSKKEIKVIIFDYLKMMKDDIKKINIDLVRMLDSTDPCIKILCLRLIKTFWKILDLNGFDEVVIYKIRKYKAFYKLFAKHPKYSLVFKNRISKLNHNNSYINNDDSSKIVNKYGHISNLDTLKNCLNNKLVNADTKNKKIYTYFIEKINTYEISSNSAIPGIALDVPIDKNKIDPEFEMKLLGLKGLPEYKRIDDIFINIVRK